MTPQEIEQLKAYVTFSQSAFYQTYLKPYLNDISVKMASVYDKQPMSEFDCIKRDITIWAAKELVNKITQKIDSASGKLAKVAETEFRASYKKVDVPSL